MLYSQLPNWLQSQDVLLTITIMETQGDVFLSICKGDWKTVDKLLSCENQPKYFITACAHYPDIAKILLKHTMSYSQPMNRCRGQFPLEKDEEGNSPLHIAARNNNIKLVTTMLKADFDVNSKNNMSQTPLYSAMKSHSFQVAEILLSNRGRMYRMSPELQFDIVACAIEGRSVSLVEKLLDYPWFDNDKSISNFIQGTKLTENGKNLLHIAVNNSTEQDYTSRYRRLSPTFNFNIRDKRPCINYEGAALVPIVRVLLLKYKFDINMTDSKGKTPLEIAVDCESEEITEELLSHNPDIHCISNKRAFKTAIKKIHYSHIIDKFVQRGFTLESTDKNNVELFHTAAEKGYFNIVKQFVKLGINVNIQDEKCCTAIYYAIINSKVNIVTYLLRNNAFVKRCQDDNYEKMHGTYLGPLLLLTYGDDSDPERDFPYYPRINPETIRVLMEYFIQHGADINTMFSDHDYYYESPLQFMIMRQDIYQHVHTAIAAAEVLLRHGAIVNHYSTERFRGDTYLHRSIRANNQEMAKLMLDYDADVDVENNRGHTPLYVALDSQSGEAIVELLLDHGAHVVDHRYVRANSKNYGIIKIHIEKLIQADLYVSPDLVLKYSPLNNYDDTDSYRTEVELMMTTPLADSNTTTYHTLLKQTSHHEILKILRNERVWQTLESEEYRKVFPNYGYMIFGQFRRGRHRMKLVQIFLENRHLVWPQLYSECLEEIVSYLTNPELRNLVHALVPIKILNEAYKKVEDYPDYKEVEDHSDN